MLLLDHPGPLLSSRLFALLGAAHVIITVDGCDFESLPRSHVFSMHDRWFAVLSEVWGVLVADV